jgi:hypothetical protein
MGDRKRAMGAEAAEEIVAGGSEETLNFISGLAGQAS